MTPPEKRGAWYREPMVWMLILIPLTAVIGGIVTLRLAMVTDDGLVVDDYYQRGKEINRVLARDQAAARYGMSGDLSVDYRNRVMRLRLDVRPPMTLPQSVRLVLLHATRGGFDRKVEMNRTADGAYHGLMPELAPGRWHAQLEAGDWRLVGALWAPADTRLRLEPAK